jgi:hypothetical protein
MVASRHSMDAIGSDLIDWAESASDQEIIDDTVAQGLDSEAEAERVRQVLLTPIDTSVLAKRGAR